MQASFWSDIFCVTLTSWSANFSVTFLIALLTIFSAWKWNILSCLTVGPNGPPSKPQGSRQRKGVVYSILIDCWSSAVILLKFSNSDWIVSLNSFLTSSNARFAASAGPWDNCVSASCRSFVSISLNIFSVSFVMLALYVNSFYEVDWSAV